MILMAITLQVFSLLAGFVKEFEFRPLTNGSSLGHNGNCVSLTQRVDRVRRSLPEIDAYNPASLDLDSLPDQDDRVDHQQQDLSQFSLSDQVGNLFRSHKSAKLSPKPQDRQLLVDQAMHVGKEENEALRSDEQYECYRQQNIEPPRSRVDFKNYRKWAKEQGPRGMPIMDIPQEPRRANSVMDIARGPEPSYVPFVRSEILKDGGGKHFEQRNSTHEVNSLYFNPVHEYHLKRYKNYPTKKLPADYFVLKDQKVPIPINVHAKFPIYDEDVDFQPDPLQGILDEKYWLDPQEHEVVMKMYIDELNSNKGTLEHLNQQKRSVSEIDGDKKENSDCFKNSKESDSSSKEIESCNGCSKGKAMKKSNYTESADEGISYGRKLLSTDTLGNIFEKDKNYGSGANNYDDYEAEDTELQSNEHGSFFSSRKLLSFDYQDLSTGNEGVNENVFPSKRYNRMLLLNSDDTSFMSEINTNFLKAKNKNTRSLLWYDEFDDDVDSYNENNEDLQENSEPVHGSAKSDGLPAPDVVYYQSGYDYDQENYETSSDQVKIENNQLKAVPERSQTNSNEQQYEHQKVVLNQNPETVDFYKYEPNRFLPKENGKLYNVVSMSEGTLNKNNETQFVPRKTHDDQNENKDSSVKFKDNLEEQKTEKNVSESVIDANAIIKGNVLKKLPKYFISNKIGDLLQKPQQDKAKGPKKNAQIDPNKEFEIMRNETYKNASMGFTTACPDIRVKSLHKRGNSVPAPKKRRGFTDLSSIKLNQRLAAPHSYQGPGESEGAKSKEGNKSQTSVQPSSSASFTTGRPVSLVQNYSTESATTSVQNITLPKSDNEESMDSKIANDIVESVIAESERGSVMGHNLGVCRRNESLMNIKFGRIIPETEKVMRTVTNCLMDKIKDHLAKQSCILLDEELLEFLKWLVLGGESYKEYQQKIGSKLFDFIPSTPEQLTTCAAPSSPSCDQPVEPLPPNPAIVQPDISKQSFKDSYGFSNNFL